MVAYVAENPYEVLNRERKARKLADIFTRNGCGSREALVTTSEEWETLTDSIHCRPPSQETIDLVVSFLRLREDQDHDESGD